jgi:hypothetical protein
MFKVGDKVRIREDSEYYGINVNWNPAGVDGVVYRLGEHSTYVRWDTRCSNVYHERDLEYVKTLEELMEDYLGDMYS